MNEFALTSAANGVSAFPEFDPPAPASDSLAQRPFESLLNPSDDPRPASARTQPRSKPKRSQDAANGAGSDAGDSEQAACACAMAATAQHQPMDETPAAKRSASLDGTPSLTASTAGEATNSGKPLADPQAPNASALSSATPLSLLRFANLKASLGAGLEVVKPEPQAEAHGINAGIGDRGAESKIPAGARAKNTRSNTAPTAPAGARNQAEATDLAESDPEAAPLLNDEAGFDKRESLEQKPAFPALNGESQASTSAASDQNGMSAAQTMDAMQTTPDVNGNSAAAGQKLPGVASFSGAHASPADRSPVAPAAGDNAAVSGPAPAMSATPLSGHWTGTASPASTLSTTAPGLVAHRSLETFILNLPRQDSGSISVVLTPDAKTQLSLHLKMEQGHWQAQAVLDRGDSAALKSGWGNLQNRLSEHGVRLAPLVTHGDQPSAGGDGRSAGGQQRREILAEGEVPSKSTKPQARPSTPAPVQGGRREWWA